MPVCNAEAMQFHLDDIASKVAPRAHARHRERAHTKRPHIA